MDDSLGQETEDQFFDDKQMKDLHLQQIKTVEYVDGVLDALVSKAPVGTHFVITADHGECFGEDGYFGHGPRSEEHTSELQALMRISYAVFCLKKTKKTHEIIY